MTVHIIHMLHIHERLYDTTALVKTSSYMLPGPPGLPSPEEPCANNEGKVEDMMAAMTENLPLLYVRLDRLGER